MFEYFTVELRDARLSLRKIVCKGTTETGPSFRQVGRSVTKRYPADDVANQAANSTEGEMTVCHLAKKILRHSRNTTDQVFRFKGLSGPVTRANEIHSILSYYNKRPVIFFIMPSMYMYSKQYFLLSLRNKTFACLFHFTHNYMGRYYRPAPDIFSKQSQIRRLSLHS